jgi:trimeric autotransporter adhesin
MGTDREPQALPPATSLEGIDPASLREIVDVDPVSLQKIFAAIAAAQKALRSERSRTGLVAARRRGQRLGRPRAMTEAQIALARRMMAEGMTRKIIARTLKVSRSTLYIALKALPTASKPKHPSSGRAPPSATKSFHTSNKPSPENRQASPPKSFQQRNKPPPQPSNKFPPQITDTPTPSTSFRNRNKPSPRVANEHSPHSNHSPRLATIPSQQPATKPTATNSFRNRNKLSPRVATVSSPKTKLAPLLAALLFLFCLTPHVAFAQTAGGTCASAGIETAGEEGVMVCNSSDVWELALSWSATSSYGYIVPNIGNDTGSCTTAKTGELIYNGSAFEYCSGTSWTSFGGTSLNNVDVELAAGSAAAPSLSFYGDTNTGIYQSGTTNTINFSTAGTEVAGFDATGDFNLTNTGGYGYEINGTKILFIPDNDTTSIAVGESALAAQSATSEYNTALGNFALNAITTGTESTAIGYEALYKATGSPNDAYGYLAGEYITTGSGNIAIGYAAMTGTSANPLTSTTAGNIAIGDYALTSITGGATSNVAIGYEALTKSTVSSTNPNTAIGFDAMEYATTGTNNTAIGFQAMEGSAGNGMTGTGQNVAVGDSALYSIEGVVTEVTAIGYQAAYYDTGGSWNVGIGYQALYYNQTGTANVAVGVNALTGSSGSSSSSNTAVGNAALKNATGSDNTAVGYAALDAVGNTGQYNVAVGYDAMDASTGGGYNVAIGQSAMTGVLTASIGDNVGIGENSLATITGGAVGNTAVGAYALYKSSVSSTNPNTAVGFKSLEFATSATDNIAIGYEAMQGTSGNSLTGDYNTALGDSAGKIIQTTADDNTMLGYSAGVAITTGTDNTLVGFKSGYGVSGSHNIILGEDPSSAITAGNSNILIGNSLSNVTSSTSSQLDIGDLIMGSISATEVGIGTTSYQGQGLTVSGDVWATIFQMTSDARLKTDIRPLADALGRIAQVKGVTYEWKPPEAREIGKDMSLPLNQPQMGVLAQDVEAVFPEAVTTGPNGLKSVNYESLAAPLIEAVKTLKRQNETLMAAVGLLYVALVALTAVFAALAVLFLIRIRQTRTP